MCRLLGVVTRTAMCLADSLDGHIEPFTELSCERADGWGVAVWQVGGMRIIREPGPAHRSPAYARAVGTNVTDTAVLHLRMATPSLAVTAGNTHPFAVGGVALAHNGYFKPGEAPSSWMTSPS
jgi:predicted glutamine amidotransferase